MSTESYAGDDPTRGPSGPAVRGPRESDDPDPQSESTKDGAKVAGATGLVEDPETKAPIRPIPSGGATASPADEQPADQMPETEASDPGVGPAHVAGTTRGEDVSDD